MIIIYEVKNDMNEGYVYSPKDHTFVLCAYKESEYIEDCIISLMNQSVKSNILISTSTPNEYIYSISKKYNIPVTENLGKTGIGGDWNWGYDHVLTKLVTIAHQDDIYEKDYLKEAIEYINRAKNPIMYFCGYGEIRSGKKIYSSKLLKIKKFMLFPLRIRAFWNSRFIRRRVLSFGCPICCPSVTMVKKRFGDTPFLHDFLSDVDWQQWEIQSKKKGSFVYNSNPLMCHRIHMDSATSEIIGDNLRTEEDYQMLLKFWCRPIAKMINRFYSKSQNSNNME